MIKVATVCTGIGAPEQAIKELGIDHEIVFGCEIDKYARITYQANFSPHTMYEDMTTESWEGDHYYSDLFIGGIPCQAFSLAGKRLGELDPIGLLFYNFYDYVKKQKPKSFIIENVKGLLSDDGGKTFQNWLQLLGNSVNTQPVMFPHPDSLGYNLHWTVLNSKDFGVPQNRERVFLVGIQEDLPNTFRFPVGWSLDTRLKDVLEDNVPEKYFLSDKMIAGLIQHNENSKEKGRGFNFQPVSEDDIAKCLRANSFKMGPDDNYVFDKLTPFGTSQDQKLSPLDGVSQTLNSGHFNQPKIMVDDLQSAKTGLHFVGAIQKGVFDNSKNSRDYPQGSRIYHEEGIAQAITATGAGIGGSSGAHMVEGKIQQLPRGNNKGGMNEICPTITSNSFEQNNILHVDDVIIEHRGHKDKEARFIHNGIAPCLRAESHGHESKVITKKRIRRLTPRECMRLQGFPDSFDISNVSDTQAYKQAGNSITVSVMKAIIKNLLPIL